MEKFCFWCGKPLQGRAIRWCDKRCRQTAWRSRTPSRPHPVALAGPGDVPRRLAYADPPYPGLSKKYYGKETSYAGEVNHVDLIERLKAYDGWGLSTSKNALPYILSLCPRGIIICPWIKSHNPPIGLGPVNIHEYLLIVPARVRRPGPPDALYGAAARLGDSHLIGRKPLKFIRWLFNLLGASPIDTFDDLYPGSGIVGRTWREFVRCRQDPPAAGDGPG